MIIEINVEELDQQIFYISCIYIFIGSKALNHLLLCQSTMHPDGEHIDLAIRAVGESKSEELAQKLTDYLMGDADDSPKVCTH